MQIRKHHWFDSTSDLLEHIIDGGIVIAPGTRLELVESGVHERSFVADMDGIRLAP